MNVALDMQLDDKLPLLKCDGSQMQQVLINLIMNAAEAAQGRNPGIVCVRTGTSTNGSDLVLEIHDNGIGIPPENIAKLFTPFFTTKGEGKGVGLGLAVVYGIVQAHDGDIEVQSKVGEGTAFIVTMPLKGPAVALPASGTSREHPA
jgi:two-component system NtrC family sensor kinase